MRRQDVLGVVGRLGEGAVRWVRRGQQGCRGSGYVVLVMCAYGARQQGRGEGRGSAEWEAGDRNGFQAGPIGRSYRQVLQAGPTGGSYRQVTRASGIRSP